MQMKNESNKITDLKFSQTFLIFSFCFFFETKVKKTGKSKKHFVLFTVEVDKRIFDVYVFIQFGVLLM